MRYKPEHILVVDDDPVIRDMMADILEMEGYTIDMARDGREALTLLQATDAPGYLLFLDLMMPVMDGYALCQELNADPDLRARQVIVIMSALDHISMASALYPDAIMPKPFVIDDLLAIIATWMGEVDLHTDN